MSCIHIFQTSDKQKKALLSPSGKATSVFGHSIFLFQFSSIYIFADILEIIKSPWNPLNVRLKSLGHIFPVSRVSKLQGSVCGLWLKIPIKQPAASSFRSSQVFSVLFNFTFQIMGKEMEL